MCKKMNTLEVQAMVKACAGQVTRVSIVNAHTLSFFCIKSDKYVLNGFKWVGSIIHFLISEATAVLI